MTVKPDKPRVCPQCGVTTHSRLICNNAGCAGQRTAPAPAKPRLDPMLRKFKIRIPVLKFTLTHPTPEQVRAARVSAGLTQVQAAKAVGLSHMNRWAEYENGTRTPDVARWALFQLLVRQHPEWRLKRTKHQHLLRGKP